MANPKLKPRLKQHSNNFPISSPTPTLTTPISEFANSELGKVMNKKVILQKFSSILKRKENKGITLKDLDALQLELETLLLSSINRGKILLNECSVLEKELKISDLQIIPIEKKTTITCNLQQNETFAHITKGFIKIVVPKSNICSPVLTKKRRLTRKKDNLATPLPPQSTAQKSPEKIKLEINVGLDQTTDPEVENRMSCMMQPNKLDDKNTILVNSSCLEGLVLGNSLKEDLGSVAAYNLNASEQKQNLKEAKKKRTSKTGKAGGVTNARPRNRAAGSRHFEPSKKYWQSVSNICRTILDPDIKALEDLLKNQETIERNLKEPSLAGGQLFATKWAELELNEEKVAACETPVPRKPTGLKPEDVLSLIKRAEKQIEQDKSDECLGSDLLYNQLLTSLIDENIILKTQQENKPVTVLQSVMEEETLSNITDMESAIRLELASEGILSNENIVRADSKQETEIDVEIKLTQDKLRALIKCNTTELSRVVKLAKLEVHKQNLTRQLINKGKEIEKAYHSILAHKKKGEPVRKHLKKALRLVQEREIIVSKLNNPIKV